MIAHMGVPGRHEHLRHSALDLLAAGNSAASVAQLLAVPVSLVVRWRNEPVPPRHDPPTLRPAPNAHGKAMHFRTTLTHAAPLAFRIQHYLWAVLISGLVAAVAVGVLRDPATNFHDHGDLLETAVVLAIAVVVCLRRSRVSLILGPEAFVVPRLIGRTTLPYSDMADYWLVGYTLNEGTDHEREGRMLTLHSRRPGVRPIEVFIDDDHALDPQVVERLELVKQANTKAGPLTRIGEASRG